MTGGETDMTWSCAELMSGYQPRSIYYVWIPRCLLCGKRSIWESLLSRKSILQCISTRTIWIISLHSTMYLSLIPEFLTSLLTCLYLKLSELISTICFSLNISSIIFVDTYIHNMNIIQLNGRCIVQYVFLDMYISIYKYPHKYCT